MGTSVSVRLAGTSTTGARAEFGRIAAAFASPKRIELIDLLAQGERNVETLAREGGLTVANTSRHLQILKAAGLVTARKEALQVF